jgi:hypothetical protein
MPERLIHAGHECIDPTLRRRHRRRPAGERAAERLPRRPCTAVEELMPQRAVYPPAEYIQPAGCPRRHSRRRGQLPTPRLPRRPRSVERGAMPERLIRADHEYIDPTRSPGDGRRIPTGLPRRTRRSKHSPQCLEARHAQRRVVQRLIGPAHENIDPTWPRRHRRLSGEPPTQVLPAAPDQRSTRWFGDHQAHQHN